MKVKAIKKDHAEQLVESIRKAIQFSLVVQEQTVDSYNPQTKKIYDEHCVREQTLVAVLKAIEGDFIDLKILSGNS